uniref:RNase H type-1 domain-containing protein n=1 Tax=Trichogramma kaykai TaxID=54128 RepID=A0ABD2XN55_9HYME
MQEFRDFFTRGDKLYKANQIHKDIELIWVPSHIGITGNENADTAAKAAAESGSINQAEIPYSDIFSVIKQKCISEDQEKIVNMAQNKGQLYFNIFYKKNAQPWFSEFKYLNRRAIVSINRIRCNHTSLKADLHRFKIIESSLCDCDGKSEQNIEHIFWQCKKCTKERKELVSQLNSLNYFEPFNLRALLAKNDTNIIYAISSFINQIKIKI